MKKKSIIIGIVLLAIIVIAYSNKNNSVQSDEDNIIPPQLDAPVETSESSFKQNELNKNTFDPMDVMLNPQNEKDKKFNELSLSLATSDPEGIERALKILAHQSALDAGFSEDAARKLMSGDPDDSLLSIDSLPDELQSSIKEELEKNNKNGYDEVSEEDAEGIINIVNYIVDTSPTIPNIRFTLSNIPDIINFNYNYIGYSFPNTSVLGTASLGIQGTARRVYQHLDESHILIVQESTLQSGSANLIQEFVNTKAFGYPAIYAIKKTPSDKTYAMLNWRAKDFSYNLYLINSLENAQNILGAIGNSLTEINLKDKVPTQEKSIVPPVEEQPKPNSPF